MKTDTMKPMSRAQWRKVLAEMTAAELALAETGRPSNPAGEQSEPDIDRQLLELRERLYEVHRRYEQGLPVLPLGRCPFTGQLARFGIDTFGLEGAWWNCDAPIRPIAELPSTVFAFTGAMKLPKSPPDLPFLCKPGPGVPFVIPRLIGRPEIRAVVSRIEIGGQPAWPILYFADPVPHHILRVNEWGTGRYIASKEDGEGYVAVSADLPEDYDYDLEPWIYAGKLLWIAPDDEGLTLQTARRHCPYLDLPGRREPACLQGGTTWSSLIS